MSEKQTQGLDEILESIEMIKKAYSPPQALNPPQPAAPPQGAPPPQGGAMPPQGPPPEAMPPQGGMPPPPPQGAAPGGPDPINEILNAMQQMGQMVDQMTQEGKKLEENNQHLAQRIEQYEARQSAVDAKMEMLMKILNSPPAGPAMPGVM